MKNNFSQKDIECLVRIHDNWQKKYNESISIAQGTLKIDVLARRIDVIKEYIDWAFDAKEKGVPISTTSSKSNALEDVSKFNNFHVYRIAEHIYQSATTTKQKQKALTELEKIIKYLTPSYNYTKTYQDLLLLINRLKSALIVQ